MSIKIQTRRDTAANWAASNAVLADGERGREKDTGREKVGDGATAWGALAYEGDKLFAPKPAFALIRPTGDPVADLAAINAGLVTGDVVVTGNFVLAGKIIHPSYRTLTLWNATITLAAGANSNVWVNSHQDATGNDQIMIQGIGRAQIIGQFGSLLAGSAGVGATTLNLAAPVAPGPYYVGESYDVNAEPVTITAVTGTAAPYTATLAAPLTAAHTTASWSWCSSQLRTQTNRWAHIGILPVNVRGFTMRNVEIGPMNFLTFCAQGCTDVLVENVRINTDSLTPNQDGIDLFGCQRVIVRGIRGRSGDDFSLCMSQTTTAAIHPYLRTAATMPDTYDILYEDIMVDSAGSIIRLIAGDGKQVHRVRGNSIHSLKTVNGIRITPVCSLLLVGGPLGANGAVTVYPAPTDISDVILTNVTPRRLRLVSFGYAGSDVKISNVMMDDYQLRAIDVYSAVTVRGVEITGVTSTEDSTAAGAVEEALGVIAGATLDGVTLSGWRQHQALAIAGTAVAGTVSNLTVDGMRIGTARAPLFTTAPTSGRINGVSVAAATGNQRLGVALPLKFGADMPVITSADTLPAPVSGSQITCAAGVDPTGGNATAGGIYIGDGTSWNRLVALAHDPSGSTTTVSPPGQVTGLSAGTPTTSSVPLSWTSVTGATGYVVESQTSGASSWTTFGTISGTSTTVTGLMAGTAYVFRITATNSGGSGTPSSTATATTTAAADSTAPTVPTALTATSGAGRNTLAWTASTDNVAVTGYKVYRGGTFLAGATTTSYIDSAVAAGVPYTYTVTAIDAAGNESGQSTSASATPAAGSTPETVTFTDPFTRADQTGGLGNGWTVLAGAANTGLISSNQAGSAYGTASATKYYIPPTSPSSPNQFAQITVAAYPTSTITHPHLMVRASASGAAINGYLVRYNPATTAFELIKFVGGASTTVATAVTALPTAGYTLRAEVDSTNTVRAKYNGVEVTGLTWTDPSSPLTSGTPVMAFRSTKSADDTQRADDFVCGVLAGG